MDSHNLFLTRTTYRLLRSLEALDLCALGGKGVPPIAVAVVKNRAGLENLLDAHRVLSNNADHHVCEFAETKGLFDDRAHADVAGIIFSVANGNLLG